MPLQTITVPLEGSEFSTRAIAPAAAVAQRAGVSLTLVGIATGDDVGPLAAKVDHAASLVPDGVPVEEEVLANPDPVVVLMTRAEELLRRVHEAVLVLPGDAS